MRVPPRHRPVRALGSELAVTSRTEASELQSCAGTGWKLPSSGLLRVFPTVSLYDDYPSRLGLLP